MEKKTKSKKTTKECNTSSIITEKQNVNTIQDGYSYPENKIIRFEASDNEVEEETPLLRILPQQVYSGGNTNTPTVNAQTHKKTRRGKRGGKNSTKNETSQITQSFLDFIVNEEPSVIMEPTPKQEQPNESVLKETSAIEQVEGNDSICALTNEKPLPSIGSIIQFSHVVMNYETLSPEMKVVRGVVKKYENTKLVMCSISEGFVVVYSEELDELIKVGFFLLLHV